MRLGLDICEGYPIKSQGFEDSLFQSYRGVIGLTLWCSFLNRNPTCDGTAPYSILNAWIMPCTCLTMVILVVLRSYIDTTQDPLARKQVPGSFALELQQHDLDEHQAWLKPRPPKGLNLGETCILYQAFAFTDCKIYTLAPAMRNADGSAHVEMGRWNSDALSGWIWGGESNPVWGIPTKEGTVILGNVHFKVSNSIFCQWEDDQRSDL